MRLIKSIIVFSLCTMAVSEINEISISSVTDALRNAFDTAKIYGGQEAVNMFVDGFQRGIDFGENLEKAAKNGLCSIDDDWVETSVNVGLQFLNKATKAMIYIGEEDELEPLISLAIASLENMKQKANECGFDFYCEDYLILLGQPLF